MRICDVLEISIKNLLRRKTRTILTIIGVMIGTTSITIMMSIGVAMDIILNNELSKMGNMRVITVSPHSFAGQSGKGIYTDINSKKLDDNAVREISNIDGVEAVSPELSVDVKFTSGKNTAYVNLIGVTPSGMELFGYNIKDGRLLKPEDSNSVIFGSNVSSIFQDTNHKDKLRKLKAQLETNILGKVFFISFDDLFVNNNEQIKSKRQKKYHIKVVGVLQESGQNDYSAFININYLRKIIKENSYNIGAYESKKLDVGHQYDRVLVKVRELNNVDRVQKEINLMGFEVYSLIEARKQLKKTLVVVQAFLGAIGAIAILISSLGITNTMYMSIYERNKEIGIIKVLGCHLADIRKMFLAEAGLIGLIGGLTGMVLSYIISTIINMIADKYISLAGAAI